jgi:hypothetical protein
MHGRSSRIRALLFSVALMPLVAHSGASLPTDVLTVPVAELRARIDQETATVAKRLTSAGQQTVQHSLSRFYQWVNAYCGVADSQKDLTSDDATCARNQYINYLARIPDSVYRVGAWTVYETGIYALLWADDNLQGADPQRPFTWQLEVIWPRVDSGSLQPLSSQATQSLADAIHTYQARWVQTGWEGYVDVHVEAINACYASATIMESTYSGGAHPYEDAHVFNWDQSAHRPLRSEDLFGDRQDWQRALLDLYRKHLQSSGQDISDETVFSDEVLKPWIIGNYVVTDPGLRIIGREGRSRVQLIPAVDIAWSELSPWLVSSARCRAISRS